MVSFRNRFQSWAIALQCIVALAFMMTACDDDDYSVSQADRLYFSQDSVTLDTVFSNVPTTTRSFWVYNKTGSHLKCSTVRLENGNQTGFRVNVDGVYLGAENGFQTTEVEVRKGDSIRVFVELTSPFNHAEEPQWLEDQLIFQLESGLQQKVNLNAWSWDAELLDGLDIQRDTTLAPTGPVVLRKSIVVDSAATLTVAAGTTLYFHDGAGIDVYGRLLCEGTAENNIVLRGDRLDRMFDYLPYDNVSGQWSGIRIHESSYGNLLLFTDLHSAFDGVVVDSSDVEKLKLEVTCSTIHNCQGYGLKATSAQVLVQSSQITNTLNDCLAVYGGITEVNNVTLAQFYPYDSNRGVALRFSALQHPVVSFYCHNTLVTGYADDEIMGEANDSTTQFNYMFENCILRTPAITTDDSVRFASVSFEDVEDTTQTGAKHFKKIDTQNLRYDFHLDSISPAIGKSSATTSYPFDRDGNPRSIGYDIGAYIYQKE